MRVLFFGDSITQGFWGIDGGWVERLRKHYDSLAIQDLANNKQPEIFNLGISGNTTQNLAQRIVHETEARIWENDPLIAVIAIGTNDSWFKNNIRSISPEDSKNNLEKIITSVKPLVKAIVLIGIPACDEALTTPVAWGDYFYTNQGLSEIEQVIADAATAHKLTFVHIFDDFKTELDAGAHLLADGLHPNDDGHQFIANKVRPVLDEVVCKVS